MKELILLRGLPGAGKTTIAGILSEGKYPVLSVDDFFTDTEGNYHFEYDKNHLAYAQCQEKTRHAMSEGTEKIFVHNTFTMDWEMKPYLEMAEEFGYRLHVLTVEKYHDRENMHDISEEQIRKMAEKYKVKLM
jgi:predicted kinase